MSLIPTASELKQLSESTFRAEVRTTLQLAVPLGGIQLSEAAVGFINTVMMGWLGLQSLAAGALGAITFYTLTFICMGIVEGASPLAAEAFGAGKTDRIRRLLAQGLWLVVALCLPIMLLTWHLDSILMLLGQQENTVVLARTYLHAIVWGFPAAVGFFILKEVATALNRPQLISAIALTSILLNATANYILLFGKLGLPALGLAGIGWASAFVYWVNFIAAAAIVGFHPQFREYKLFGSLGFDRELFTELWQNGWPVGLEYAASFLQFTIITLLSGYLGTAILAANEIVVQTIEVSLIVPTATSFAAMTRVGQLMGQNNPRGARRAGFAAIAIGAAVIGLFAVALWLFPGRVAAIYLDPSNPANAIAIRSAIPLLRTSALFLIACTLNIVAIGILMGIKDIRLPILINILIYWSIGMGSSYLLGFTLNWGGIGLWSGLTIGTMLGTVFLICRFYLSITELIHSSEDEAALDKSQSTDDAQTPVLK